MTEYRTLPPTRPGDFRVGDLLADFDFATEDWSTTKGTVITEVNTLEDGRVVFVYGENTFGVPESLPMHPDETVEGALREVEKN